MKPAILTSLFTAALAFFFVLDQTAALAGQRALIVFAGVFLWSYVAFHLMSRLAPPGKYLFSAGGPKPTGKGDAKVVDLEKQSIDREKLEQLLR